MRSGHWYLAWELDGETVEWAVPAGVPIHHAQLLIAQLLPHHHYRGYTWRASFDQRWMPSNSQPTFGQHFDAKDVALKVMADDEVMAHIKEQLSLSSPALHAVPSPPRAAAPSTSTETEAQGNGAA